MLQCWEYNPKNRPSFRDCWTQLDLVLQDFQDSNQVTPFPPLHDVHFDPYSYSEGGGSAHYTPNQLQHQRQDSDSVFFPDELQFDRDRVRLPSYLEVLSEEELSPRHSLSTHDEGYEIPLPKRPPRSQKHHHHQPPRPSTTEIGLPSPTYWNTETLPLRSQYRNLLASSTSEDADTEDGGQQFIEQECSIQGHHYFPNLGSSSGTRSHHLRGIPCQYSTQPTLYNNHLYAAQHLNGESGREFQRPRVVDPTNSA